VTLLDRAMVLLREIRDDHEGLLEQGFVHDRMTREQWHQVDAVVAAYDETQKGHPAVPEAPSTPPQNPEDPDPEHGPDGRF
jgi:hypothetical protein